MGAIRKLDSATLNSYTASALTYCYHLSFIDVLAL